ncbi:MAG: pimeloyl-ACP methyl ester esterase BioH [Proteobacteria bacterium]|nr:pimeloyl-ACP methyl ester esterase BioH [Pseudomonadota bacterium]
MHIDIRGDGPPLVMIHGWAMHCGLFGALLDRLAAQRTLYLVDLPGHGRSRDDDSPLDLESCVAAIVAQTPPAPWLGWSLGGLFALHAALTRPTQATALLMLCSTPRFVHAPDWPQGMDVEIFRRFEAGLQDNLHATVERFLALETLGCEHAKAGLRALRTEVFAHGDPTSTALADGLRLLEESDLRAALPTLQVPSLWIGARRDRLVDPHAVAAAAALAPQSRHLQLDSGHAPFLTHADALGEAILGFLGEPSASDLSPLPLGEADAPTARRVRERTIRSTCISAYSRFSPSSALRAPSPGGGRKKPSV